MSWYIDTALYLRILSILKWLGLHLVHTPLFLFLVGSASYLKTYLLALSFINNFMFMSQFPLCFIVFTKRLLLFKFILLLKYNLVILNFVFIDPSPPQ